MSHLSRMAPGAGGAQAPEAERFTSVVHGHPCWVADLSAA